MVDLECGVCHTRFEVDLRDAMAAGRIACPTCKRAGDQPGDLELLESLGGVAEVLTRAKSSFAFNALHVTAKPRLPSPAPRSTDDEETAIGWAETRYETALAACRSGRW